MQISNRGGNGNRGGRRKSAIRSGLLAVSAATASFCGALTARGDITNGFSGFAPVNFTGQSSVGSVGYSPSGNLFELTDNRSSEATSGYYVTPQNIASFDCTYTYVEPTSASAAADGITFVIQNSSAGSTALGAGGGGLGYTGIGNSEALAFNVYTGYVVGSELLSGGTDNNSYATPKNIGSLASGDQIQVTLEYFNNTLTANYVDLKTNASFGQIYSGVNIPAAVGSSTAYVGFTGGTGASKCTQQVSNFTFVSGTGPSGVRLYQPVAFTGYNQQGVISVAGGQSSVTATMDGGTSKSNDTWYEKGWNTYNASTGLPTSGSTFTSQYDSSHVFQMPNYSANDVVLLSTASKTATMNFNTPSAYSTLSFLESCGNGPSSFKVTVNYADGAPSTTGLSVITPDWFNGGPSAYYAAGRDTLTSNPASQPDTYAQGTGPGTGPNLYEEDLILPDSTDPIASLSLTFSGTNTGTNMMIFAVSGVVANSAPLVTYTGATVAGKFDTSTINFSQNSSGTVTPVAFSNGDQVVFDDTATDTLHNITVATLSSGVKPGGLIFNNTTATNPYTFTGAGIGGPGGISVNGGGTVIFNNPNTFSGGAYINSGTLVIGTGGTLASTTISISSGATMQVSGGTLTGTGISLSDAGTFNYSPGSLSLASLTGNGVLTSLNAAGTNLTLTGGGVFSGTMSLGTGSLTINANGSTVALTSSNTYSGGTYLVAGLLQAGLSSSISNVTGSVYFQGGSLGTSSLSTVASTVTITNPLVYTQAKGLTFDASNPVVITNNNSTIPLFNGSMPLVVTGGTYAGANNGVTATISSQITDPAVGSGALNVTGFALVLGGSNTYSGGTTLNTTTDVLATNPASFGTGPLNFNNGGIGVTNGSSGLVLPNAWTFGTSQNAYFENNAAFTMAGPGFLGTGGNASFGTIYVYAPMVTLSGNISGGALILGSGSTVLELSGTTNTFTGPIIVSGGVLKVDSAGAIAGLNPALNASQGSITVSTAGSLMINDTTGLLGLAGGVAGGAPITLNLSGTGNGGTGALTTPGGTGLNYTWAGNINASGPALIAPGYGASSSPTTITLTGAITGTGPVQFAANDSSANAGYSEIVLAPTIPGSSNYSGESQVYGDATALGALTIQLGANNGFSSAPTSGLNFNSGGPGNTTVDLYGYNQSVSYLTSASTTNLLLTNSQTPMSTLTITNGNLNSGAGASFGVPITGNIAVVKTGTGNQTLTGNNTFNGGLTVAAGTLTVPAGAALGNSTVKLAGGTLALSAPSSISGFGSIATGGAATLSSGVVTLNPYAASNGSALTTAPLTISDASGFTTSFVYYPSPEGSNYTAGGMAFNIINTNSVAGGTFGNGSAWRGIAIDFSLDYTGAGTYTGLEVNGSQSVTNSYGISPWNVGDTGLAGGPITVTLTYANDTLTELLVCPNPGDAAGVTPTPGISTTFTYSNVDIASDLGASAGGAASAYVGFTGANLDGTNSTTSYNALQQISAFTFSGGGTVPVAVNTNNPIIATAGTSSVLSVSTETGNNTETLNGGLTIQSGAALKLTEVNGSSGVLVLQIPATTALSIAGAAGAWTGKLDIGKYDLDIATTTPSATLATVTSQVKSGYAGGAWTGKGITSSAAAGDSTHLTAVGVILNDTNQAGGGTALYGPANGIATTFDGATVGLDDVLVKYTYYGDANLDGAVDGSDYALVDATYLAENFSSGAATNPIGGWYNGDFNYDGVVDGSDYTLMDNAFNTQGSSLGVNPLAQIASQVGGGVVASAAVPEPATLSLLAMGATAMLGRRRRRN